MGRAANVTVAPANLRSRSMLAAAILVASVASAQAGSFALREQSTEGQGQGFAGVAAGSGGLSSMYWNPATVTARSGLEVEANAAGLFPRSEVTPQPGTSPILLGLGGTGDSGDLSFDALLPSVYTSYQLNERVWLGLATTTPFGLATKYDTPFAGQVYARTSKVFSLDVNPTVGVKVTDWLSVGAGARALYFDTTLSRSLSPAPFAPNARLEGDDIGFGFTAGVMVEPMDGTSIGLGYRSSVDLALEGDLTLGLPAGTLPAGTYGIDADVTLPEKITIGLHQAVTEKIALSAGFEWTNWSRLGTIPVIGNDGFTTGAQLTELVFEYDDGYYASLGAEYAWSPELTLRAGVAYEWSPIDVDTRDLRLPDSDRIHVALGASYSWNDKLSIDLAYTHLFTTGDTDIELVPGNPSFETGLPFVGSVDGAVDLLSLGVSYKF